MNEEQINILQMQKLTGAQFVQVSFTTGQVAAMVAVLGGRSKSMSVTRQKRWGPVKNGDIRSWESWTTRESLLPGVKTFEAQGYKVYSSSSRGYLLPLEPPSRSWTSWPGP